MGMMDPIYSFTEQERTLTLTGLSASAHTTFVLSALKPSQHYFTKLTAKVSPSKRTQHEEVCRKRHEITTKADTMKGSQAASFRCGKHASAGNAPCTQTTQVRTQAKHLPLPRPTCK